MKFEADPTTKNTIVKAALGDVIAFWERAACAALAGIASAESSGDPDDDADMAANRANELLATWLGWFANADELRADIKRRGFVWEVNAPSVYNEYNLEYEAAATEGAITK